MEYIIGIIVALCGLLGYNIIKRKSAEALNENIDTKEKILKDKEEIVKDQGLMQVEEERRKQIEKEIEEAKEKSAKESLENLNDFFNRKK